MRRWTFDGRHSGELKENFIGIYFWLFWIAGKKGPRQKGPRKKVPVKNGLRKNSPRKNGPHSPVSHSLIYVGSWSERWLCFSVCAVVGWDQSIKIKKFVQLPWVKFPIIPVTDNAFSGTFSWDFFSRVPLFREPLLPELFFREPFFRRFFPGVFFSRTPFCYGEYYTSAVYLL